MPNKVYPSNVLIPFQVRIEFYLNRYGSKSQIKSAISRAYYEGSSTATGTALLVMKRYLFSTAGGMRNDKSIPKVNYFHIVQL